MSDTKVDLPKVTQLLDAGWDVQIFKNVIGSYTARCSNGVRKVMVITDDFTPEQALTRLAYKVIDGEVL